MNLYPIHQKLCFLQAGHVAQLTTWLLCRLAPKLYTRLWSVQPAGKTLNTVFTVWWMDWESLWNEGMNELVREGAEDGRVALGQLKQRGCSKAAFCFSDCLSKKCESPSDSGV